MVTQVTNSYTKIQDLTFSLIKKIQSVPGVAIFALVGLLVGMCVYFGPLETYAPITNWYHTIFSNDYWRHLLIRAAPEATVAGWYAQCVAIVSVVNGRIKNYRVMHTHELFWRPLVGLIFMLPGAAVAAGLIWLGQHWHLGHRIGSAAKAFCQAGVNGHCLSNHLNAVVASHPGVLRQFEQSVLLDGNKKLIVIAGLFVFGIFAMTQYFLNVQGWLAENRILEVDAKNKQKDHLNKRHVPYTRFYHRILPGYFLRIRFIVDNMDKTVPCTKGHMVSIHLNEQNHGPINNHIYSTFKAITVSGILGGLYIMFYIAQGTNLALVVHH